MGTVFEVNRLFPLISFSILHVVRLLLGILCAAVCEVGGIGDEKEGLGKRKGRVGWASREREGAFFRFFGWLLLLSISRQNRTRAPFPFDNTWEHTGASASHHLEREKRKV